MIAINKIHCIDAREGLKKLPNESVDCVVTSPPFWALRDYGKAAATIWEAKPGCKHRWGNPYLLKRSGDEATAGTGNHRAGVGHYVNKSAFCTKCEAWKGQLGLEPIFELYLAHLLDIFGEIERVLKPTGTLWLHLGDTYSGSWGNYAPNGIQGKQRARTRAGQRWTRKAYQDTQLRPSSSFQQSVKEKSLCLIPERFALALVERGWILRNTVIWHKPNGIPSSAKDRFTVDFEKLFFFAKNKRYCFDTQFEPASANDRQPASKRIKRCVWAIANRPFKEAHFAVFPEQLVEIPIRAGCPPGGLVLDPFTGAGTTAVVAKRIGRKFLGFEINPQYVKMAESRIKESLKEVVNEAA